MNNQPDMKKLVSWSKCLEFQQADRPEMLAMYDKAFNVLSNQEWYASLKESYMGMFHPGITESGPSNTTTTSLSYRRVGCLA